MILCITEKPKVADAIAQILGAKVKRDGYWEGGNYKITWTFGHLCELKEPHDYTEQWKRWSLSALPMIPPRFSIKLKKDKGIEHQFEVIKHLVGEASEVINCGDAGQEGELIQRWVLQLAGCRVPIKRLWTSSLTDEAIRQGFANLKPEKDYNNLYLAGLSRAAGDWLLGMNATRLYSLKYSEPGKVLSIGRVQTPTLALIVRRQREIRNFKPEDYWELKTLYRDVTFSATSGRFDSEAKANEALELIKTAPFTITSVQQKAGKEAPQRLFDLTSLQVECNRRWGWTADRTLQLIQSLYEKKVTTYPRVDTTYLPDDVYPKVPEILSKMTPYAPQTAPLLAPGVKIPKTKKIFDNSKVTDHHAIIPTGESPRTLAGDEKLMYHLIAMRFIAAFYPDCEFQTTTVLGRAVDVEFKATGKVITKPGWRDLFKTDKDEKPDDEDAAILPPFTEGESGPHEPALQKKQTQPPKPYNEGTLLRAMEGAGKTVDDETLREALKENGIGRPSTRAAIIETLFRRHYIARERKNVVATEAGEALIDLINEELLKSAKLTGLWENKLRRIERGQYSPTEFMDELKEMINQIVISVLSDNSQRRINIVDEAPKAKKTATAAPKEKKPRAPRIKSIEEIQCPVCSTGHLLKGRTAYGCSRFREGCSLRLPFEQYPADLTPAKLRTQLTKKK